MNDERSVNVLFVCVENSCRSQMAEGFARNLGGELVNAYSAGSAPSGKVNDKSIVSMREIGIDLTGHRSMGLEELPEIEFDAAVTMGCGDSCPTVRARLREDWEIPCPKHMKPSEFAGVRDRIREQVRDLLRRLAIPAE